ncbi:hypothetical protein ILYODFUR_028684 [Ilyodon furcidens]|uniref:Uncharacterized protein n=1 Tax=Ilyodon furcidens TaxID=33524 RepID=A0ABV0T141_9TELE
MVGGQQWPAPRGNKVQVISAPTCHSATPCRAGQAQSPAPLGPGFPQNPGRMTAQHLAGVDPLRPQNLSGRRNHGSQNSERTRRPEAALIEADFPHGLGKKAGTTVHAFLRVRPGSESYPNTSQPFKEPNIPLSYGSAGPPKSPFPQL